MSSSASTSASRIPSCPSPGTFLVRGDVAIRDVSRSLAIDLEEAEGASTIAGLCAVLAGGVVPARGARLAAQGGAVLVVIDASVRVVRRVRVIPPPAPTGAAGRPARQQRSDHRQDRRGRSEAKK